MLARPAASLSTGVTKISSVDKTNKIRCHGNDATSLEGSKKTVRHIDHLQPYSSTNPENLTNISQVDFEIIIGRT